ncbi:MAG TPA: AAA family ATPase, partial [Thermodesulfobacteriota bacterium]
MLLELSIKDFAIIESLSIAFGPGLNIFTGETGAGKSIILDAIALILGDRASNEIIREGREEAQVQALFDISGLRKTIDGALTEAGIEPAAELIIKRVVQRAGRNRIYINGSLATLVTLTEIGRRLLDIYGQSEHTSLTRPEEHIEVLDSFGGFSGLRAYM